MALLLANTSALAAKTNYKSHIEGGAVGSPGTGTGNFTFDDATKRLCGKVTYAGLTGGAVTVAALKEGTGFTIVEPLTVSCSPLFIDVTLGDAAVPLLSTGPIYIAIGNATHGVAGGEQLNGEVNGELVVDLGGVEQPCGGSAADAGLDAGCESDAALPASSDGGGTEDATAPPPGAAPASAPEAAVVTAPNEAVGGCSTTGSSTSNAAVFVIVSAFIIAMRERRRR